MCTANKLQEGLGGGKGAGRKKKGGCKGRVGGTSEIGDVLSGALEQSPHLPSLETLNRPTPKHSSL